ncbi:hypothetical protein HD806DRAFT_538460 [Xylariaceae sp. AK1471]|nr:hypothetical protein HD806DRAFT_538460 [Xylariaceae sp. AK1471]
MSDSRRHSIDNSPVDWKNLKRPSYIEPTIKALIFLARQSFQLVREVWYGTRECLDNIARLYEELFLLHYVSFATLARTFLQFGLLLAFCCFAIIARAFATFSRWIDAVIEAQRGPPPPTKQRTSPTEVHFGVREMAPQIPAPFTPARSSHRPSLPASTRKISASFSTDGPLSGHPTTAYSTITASTSTSHPGLLTSHLVNMSSALSSSLSYGNMDTSMPDRTLKASHTYSNLPMPATHHKAHASKPSITGSYTNATGRPYRKAENIPPSTSMAFLSTNKKSKSNYPTPRPVPQPSPKKKSKSRVGIPKSRTFNVLSNLTASLSRTSLGHFTSSDSTRRTSTSTSSKGTARRDPAPCMNPRSSTSNSSQVLLPPVVIEPTNPRQIYTAQTSAYWAGRFMALQDRFQSETLMPKNLATLVHAHAERSLLPRDKPSLASSATMSCITPSANTNTKPKLTHSTTGSMSPRKPQQQLRPKLQPKAASQTPRSTTAVATAQPSYQHAAALLADEDNRCRRIFLHLDALCTTSEARMSLQQWQQSYARRVGNENLLPEGGTMHERTRELTWVGRLLIGSGNGHSKRGNFAL